MNGVTSKSKASWRCGRLTRRAIIRQVCTMHCGLVSVYSLSSTAHEHIPVVAELNSQTLPTHPPQRVWTPRSPWSLGSKGGELGESPTFLQRPNLAGDTPRQARSFQKRASTHTNARAM